MYVPTDLQARVDIPTPSVRTIQRKIAASKFDRCFYSCKNDFLFNSIIISLCKF